MLVFPAALLALAAAASPAPADEPRQPTYVVTCTFTNPAYVGPCTVDEEVPARVAPRAACRRILACLSNVRCTKTYCNATTIRSGWRLVTAERKAAR